MNRTDSIKNNKFVNREVSIFHVIGEIAFLAAASALTLGLCLVF